MLFVSEQASQDESIPAWRRQAEDSLRALDTPRWQPEAPVVGLQLSVVPDELAPDDGPGGLRPGLGNRLKARIVVPGSGGRWKSAGGRVGPPPLRLGRRVVDRAGRVAARRGRPRPQPPAGTRVAGPVRRRGPRAVAAHRDRGRGGDRDRPRRRPARGRARATPPCGIDRVEPRRFGESWSPRPRWNRDRTVLGLYPTTTRRSTAPSRRPRGEHGDMVALVRPGRC